MLTELCGYLKNWFDKERIIDTFTLVDGVLRADHTDLSIQSGQYIRIVGSVFNDGIYQYPLNAEEMTDEAFYGAVWLLAIPKEIIAIAQDIERWMAQYGGADSSAMSPFNSESFGGYSYSKSAGASGGGTSSGDWQSAYASRLKKWRKI